MKKNSVTEKLKNKTNYLEIIDKLYQKYANTRKKFVSDNTGINISDVYLNKKNITKILKQELQNERHHIAAPDEKKIVCGLKMRRINYYSILDRLIISLLYQILS